jgi:hypothetical protein
VLRLQTLELDVEKDLKRDQERTDMRFFMFSILKMAGKQGRLTQMTPILSSYREQMYTGM